jgi:hypothetical protein
MNCPPIDQLLAFAQNELPTDEAQDIRAHLEAGCELCREQLGQLQKVISVIKTRILIDPPDWLIYQAMTLFKWWQSKSRGSPVKKIPALLVVDSFAEERLLGFRSTGPMSRQMLYRAGDYDIDLSIDYIESSQSVTIIGQSMPLSKDLTTVAEVDVELLRGSQVTCATRTNEAGEFTLDGVQEGSYDLRIRLKDEEINITNLQAIAGPPGRRVN